MSFTTYTHQYNINIPLSSSNTLIYLPSPPSIPNTYPTTYHLPLLPPSSHNIITPPSYNIHSINLHILSPFPLSPLSLYYIILSSLSCTAAIKFHTLKKMTGSKASFYQNNKFSLQISKINFRINSQFYQHLDHRFTIFFFQQ